MGKEMQTAIAVGLSAGGAVLLAAAVGMYWGGLINLVN